jgi:hypothetical protein
MQVEQSIMAEITSRVFFYATFSIDDLALVFVLCRRKKLKPNTLLIEEELDTW